jgi:bacterioferritin-associated ferredoxin
MDNMTEQEVYQWLLDNESILVNATRFTPTKQTEFFAVYNHLSTVKKAQTSCSRCVHNMRVILQSHLKTVKNMNTYPIYRTEKGNLTFKEQGEVAYTIRANSQLAADEAIAQIKAVEKRESKNKQDNV